MLRSNRNKKTLGEADQQQLMEMLIEYGRYWKTTQKWVHDRMDLVYLHHHLIVLLVMN